MKVIAFAASSSQQSINKQLATYAAGLVSNAEVEVLDLNDYELPLFSVEREAALGQPDLAKAFSQKLASADAIIVSYAEHNGTYTAAYKNLFDWVSRIDRAVFHNKPTVLLATSPGPGGAKNVLAQALASATYFAADVKASVSVASFFDHFDAATQTVTNKDIALQIQQAVSHF
ncbi:NADPH-dependent FMN reductase [Marinagarivorans algicola]|uniref:NADPH-dependent FMN reductase n=1 Tax=Marinagarivorans algicola TaxID=1513270 RepID=UPI0006B5CB64|nr:NAD(P)H-dependent oxidoreductase [Marinagarivorans algicola]